MKKQTNKLKNKKIPAHNKNYISTGVSVRTTKFAARNNDIGVRQVSNLQQHIVPNVGGHFKKAHEFKISSKI